MTKPISISFGIGKIVLAILVCALTACAARGPIETMSFEERVEYSARFAYLIVDVVVVEPPDDRQPIWLGVDVRNGFAHYPLDREVFALRTGRTRVIHVDFDIDQQSGRHTFFLESPKNRFVAKAGTIYYYGRLEVFETQNRRRARAVLDLGLLQRACAAEPVLLGLYDIVVVGPLTDEKISLPDCETLLGA